MSTSQAPPARNVSASRTRSRSPASRPVTPLRPSSRSSFRTSHQSSQVPLGENPLDAMADQFAELSDSMADLEANFMHLQLMHESLARFGESFASFLYGLNMNAFVVDFPEVWNTWTSPMPKSNLPQQPLSESIQRHRQKVSKTRSDIGDQSTILPDRTPSAKTVSNDVDSTILSDTTFASLNKTPARRRTFVPGQNNNTKTPARPGPTQTTKKSAIPSRSGSSASRGTRGGTRGSGLPTRGRGRGLR